MQRHVDELYDAGNYERALFIYQKELAPRGDKYAQYMVGYMLLNGQGAPQDRVGALAWYRLSAERGYDLLVTTRDELAATLTPEEIRASNAIFLGLLQEMGDTTLIMKLIRSDIQKLKNRTGTRISTSGLSQPMRVIRRDGLPEDVNYYRNIRTRLETRLNWLETKVEINDIALEPASDEVRQFEDQVRAELAALEVP